ncbi:MAG TPA: polymer-forming cytoskeletal protein [Polyangiaceae bacterium]
MAQTRSTPRGMEARIGPSARVRGRVQGEGNLLVEGQIEGELAIRGDLTIAEGAVVTCEAVEAHAVTISGALQGDVSATSAVRIGSGARVRGNIRGTSVSIEDGARYSGRLDCEFELPPELGGESRGDARGRTSARR